MRIPIWVTLIAAAIGLSLVLVLGQVLIRPDLPLIASAGFDDERITPNADGDQDLTRFRYSLSRNADVSLTLQDSSGMNYVFRDQEPRIAQGYEVLFSGVVNGYTLPDEEIPGVVERRLLPDGDYTWTLSATNPESGESQAVTGTISIADADAPLPIMSVFTIAPEVFTPNQDGVDDRVEINVYLEKEADLDIYLVGADGQQIPISARKEGRLPGEPGRHIFDYEGGIDLGADPPEDGTYQVVALAQDAEGQRLRRQSELTIRAGGKPLAEIVPQFVGVDVIFAHQPYDERYASQRGSLGEPVAPHDDIDDTALTLLTMPVGDLLTFKLTVENYSDVPIRTTGPAPGTVYDWDQLSASLGAFEESGAWRVGIQCENSTTSFPWRWAIGTEENLIAEEHPETGDVFYYLPPQTRSVVWGAIRMTDLEERNNPQTCWAGLIHEDVEVSLRNSRVGPREVELVDPENNTQ